LPSTLIPGSLSCLRKSSHRSVTVPPPVSLRSRTGWDPQHVNRVALAIQRSEKCPCSKPVHYRAALGGEQRAIAILIRVTGTTSKHFIITCNEIRYKRH